MPKAQWSWVLATGVVTGLAMGIRVGGVMLLCFAGVFWLLKSWRTDVKRCVLQWLAVFVVAYVVILAGGPDRSVSSSIEGIDRIYEFCRCAFEFF